MRRACEIIDSHVHCWEPDRPDRPWDRDGVVTGPPLSVEQLLADAADAGVDEIVQVTPSIMGYDNRYGVESAHRFPDRIVGVIGRFDPLGDDLPARLERYLAEPTILGARVTLIKKWRPWLREGRLEAFFAEAGRRGMPVQIYAPGQAALVGEAARRHPATTFLVDHMALSHLDPEPFASWADVLRLAAVPNVWMKVSYFPEVAREPHPFRGVHRRFEELCERFGSDRLIWGSNYPPSRQACPYRESVAYLRELPFLTDDDRAKIFGGSLLRALGARAVARRRDGASSRG